MWSPFICITKLLAVRGGERYISRQLIVESVFFLVLSILIFSPWGVQISRQFFRNLHFSWTVQIKNILTFDFVACPLMYSRKLISSCLNKRLVHVWIKQPYSSLWTDWFLLDCKSNLFSLDPLFFCRTATAAWIEHMALVFMGD